VRIRGIIESGAGQGAFFVGLDWVVAQFRQAMGFRPFPGTLNVRVWEDDPEHLERFFSHKDFELVPDNPDYCSASLRRIRINEIQAAAVFPSEDVRIHGRDVVEIIAGCNVKQSLGLQDGDTVIITDYEADSS